MSSEHLIAGNVPESVVIQSDAMPSTTTATTWIFEELPIANIVSVSRPDTGDISPMLLSYTIEFQYKQSRQMSSRLLELDSFKDNFGLDCYSYMLEFESLIEYKQFKWRLLKKASQVLYLHFALKRRAIIEEFHEKQEQVKEWLQSLGIGDQTAVMQGDEELEDEAVPSYNEESAKNRNVPSRAAFPIIRPGLGGQQSFSDRAKVAMQGYLNHFLGNMYIANSREVCKFLEVSKLSFSREYGPKLKEGYVMVKHLPRILRDDTKRKCCARHCFCCCDNNWQKVWAVLKPGFLAILEDPFGSKLLDIIVFEVLPASDENRRGRIYLANDIKERNPLRYSFKVSCGNQSIRLRTTSNVKVREWVAAINDTGLKPSEGWCHPHRFGSYSPPRGLTTDGSEAQWFVDGQTTFEAIASAIEAAKSEIFMTGWWLCPELFLRRPFHTNVSSRLDALLEAKAKQGVQIYILLYKEVALALKINSFYSKRRLLSIHENVRVLRYPDHISTGIYLWSHHEKLVIVDYHVCFIGGLDLCFGRYDTNEHKVGDCPPLLWPGKDYYNPRENEPNSWEDTMKDELDRRKYPRMPWHDVHCALWGPPCLDVARHFVQRWNFAKRNKALHERTIPLLMPRHHMVIPHYMGRSRKIDKAEQNQIEANMWGFFSSQSPVEDIPLLLPQAADGLDASDQMLNGRHTNHLLDHPSKVNGNLFQNSIIEPLVPGMQMNGFVDEHDSLNVQSEMQFGLLESGVKTSDEWQETQEHCYNVVSADLIGQVGLRIPCHCQIIRSVSQWSAGTSQTEASIHNAHCSLIEKAEHFIYIENQFFISGLLGDEIIQNRVLEALYKRILRAHKERKCFRVIIVIPLLPGFQGGLDDGGAATVRAIMHWQYRTICRGQNSILHNLNVLLGPKAHDYISFYGLRTYGSLFDGGPVATSQVYVHSKVMIIDDRAAFIGSSNINDRSLLGSRDSEIGILIEDKEFLESSMNGEPWQAGKFSHSLRASLWSEHLGLHGGEISQIADPIADAAYKDLWSATAKENSMIYQEVFACIPNDAIQSRAALRQSMAHLKEKLGHDNTIDLGIAPEKLESSQNGEIKVTDPMERLKAVKGFLVSFPLEFMCNEDLRPVFNESEFYAFPQVFH